VSRRDDGLEPGTWIVIRPSQHGEEPRTLADGFQMHDSAARWIDENLDTHPYLPYCEEVV